MPPSARAFSFFFSRFFPDEVHSTATWRFNLAFFLTFSVPLHYHPHPCFCPASVRSKEGLGKGGSEEKRDGYARFVVQPLIPRRLGLKYGFSFMACAVLAMTV